jgi:putative hydrolase of the HAD superfamily
MLLYEAPMLPPGNPAHLISEHCAAVTSEKKMWNNDRMKIFFDVDGVLIDGWHANSALRKPWDATLEADCGINRDAFQQLFFGIPGHRSATPMFECVTGRRDLKDALASALPQFGYQGSADDFMRYWFEKDSNLNAEVFRLVDVIRTKSKAKIYVATGQEHYRARYLWNELGFSKHFEAIFYSADIGHPKNDIRFFESINRALGIDAGQRPLFFDDQPEIVELAKRVGWDGTAFTSIKDIQEHPRLQHLFQ